MITSLCVFFVMGVGLGFGLGFGFGLDQGQMRVWGAVGLCCLCGLALALFAFKRVSVGQIRIKKLLALCFVLGCGAAFSYGAIKQKQAVAQLKAPDSLQTLTVQLIDLPNNQSKGARVIAKILESDDTPGAWQHQKIRLWIAGLESNDLHVLAPGQVIKIRTFLRKTRDVKNFSTSWFGFGAGWDAEQQAFLDEIAFEAQVSNLSDLQWLERSCQGVLMWINCQRYQLNQQLETTLSHSRWRGSMMALAVGNTSEIEPEIWDVYTQLGVVHLLSVSGLHITFFAMLVMWLALRLLSFYHRVVCPKQQLISNWQRVLPIVLAFLASMAVALLTGFAAPAQRTLLMLAVACVAKLWRRPIASTTQIALAMSLCLCWDPTSFLSAGFWFSCVAVYLLIMMDRSASASDNSSVVIDPWERADIPLYQRAWDWLWAHTKTSIVLAPLSLLLFGNVSLIGLIANVVAIPVVGWVITPFLLMATLFVPVSALPLLWVDQVWNGMMAVLMPLLSLPLGFWRWGALPMWAWGLVMLGVIWLVLPKSFFSRALALVCFLPLWMYQPIRLAESSSGSLARAFSQGELYLEFIDVGQGNAVWVKTAHHQLLFDTGPPTSSWALRLRLQQLGALRPDVLVLSHADNDHIGGFERLANVSTQSNVLEAKQIHASFVMNHHAYQDCSNQQPAWIWEGVSFRYLNVPARNYPNDKDNNKSCVLLIETAQQKILLAGDIESEAETRLLNVLPTEIDVLLVPHHGSRTSSGQAFLDKLNPKLAIIQAGFSNRYGHPHKDVVERYNNHQIEWRNTAETGAIGVWIKSDQRQLKMARVGHN